MDESAVDPQPTPEVVADNPAPDHTAPLEQGQGEAEVDFFDEKFDPNTLPPELLPAYKQMQKGLTQKFQSHAEERKAFEEQRQQYEQAAQLMEALQNDPETTLAELQAMLLEDEGADTDLYDEYEDVDNPVVSELQQRLERLEAEKAAEQHQQYAVQTMAADVERINKELSEPISAAELEEISQFAVPDENGVLPLYETWQRLNKFHEARQQKYLEGKRGAPPAPGGGQQGSEKFDITNRDARIKRMAAILAGGQQQ